MKLHLPTALFALAVLPAVAFAEEIEKNYVTQDANGNVEVGLIPTQRDTNTHPYALGLEIDRVYYKGDLSLTGNQKVGHFTNLETGTLQAPNGTTGNAPAKTQNTLHVEGNVTISDSARVVLDYRAGVYHHSGLEAGDVTVNTTDEVLLGSAKLNSLTITKGTVKIDWMVDNGTGIAGYAEYGPAYPGAYYFRGATIDNGLTVSGGTLLIGEGVKIGGNTYQTVSPTSYFQSVIDGKISQSGGDVKIKSQTYIKSSEISQTGGKMWIAVNDKDEKIGSNSGYNIANDVASMSRFGSDVVTITQDSKSADTQLNLNGIIVKGDTADGFMQLKIVQKDAGSINMETGKRYYDDGYYDKQYHPYTKNEYTGSLFQTQDAEHASIISQSGSGQVNIGSDYQSATFNVEQKGEGSVTLKAHGVLRSSVVSINDKSTFTVAAGGKLMLNDGAQLNLTVGTGSVGLQVANGGSITSASADSTVVVNVLLTEDAMKSNISMDKLADLLDGTADSLTFNVNIAQFGDADAAAKFAGMLTMTGNEQVLTYTPDVATVSDEGAVPTDLAITVTGFTNAGGMVQAQVSATRYTAPVPEPATATLSLLALAGLCARRRRK